MDSPKRQVTFSELPTIQEYIKETEESDLPSPRERCTIVTCYYQSPSKHSLQEYDEWMTNFLTTVENEMVIFCDNVSYTKIAKLREPFKDMTQIYILPLEETYCGSPHYQTVWKKDWQRDIERSIHHPNLYTIWNEKSMFVHRVMKLNPFQTEFFCWCDIGCFRSKEDLCLFQHGWPSKSFLKNAKKDKMYFLNITPFESRDFETYANGLSRSFERVTRIGATIFLGHQSIFETWVETYYKYMDNYITHNYFAGKDQNIIATIYVCHPELFELVKPKPGEGDPWFYLQRYFLQAT